MALEQTLISIRERHQVDLFDLALVVIRRRPWPLIGAVACGVGPFVALNAGLFRLIPAEGAWVSLFLWWVEAPLALAPLTLVLGGMMFGRAPTFGAAARQLAISSLTLLWTHGLLRYLPIFWLPPRLVFANEILLLEQGGWLKLWKRGGSLLGGREGDLAFLALIQGVAVWMVAFLATVGFGRLTQAAFAEKLTWEVPDAAMLTGLSFQLPIWGAAAYFTVVRFLTYIDQRIRLEGWEITLRLRAAGQSLAEARRW